MLQKLFWKILENSQEHCFGFCYLKNSTTRDFLEILSDFQNSCFSWFSLNNLKTVEAVALKFCRIQ